MEGIVDEGDDLRQPLLAAERLRGDSRVAEARRLLADAVADHSSGLTAVRPPRSALVAPYARLLDRLAAARGGMPIIPYLASGIGNGPWVELADGSVKLDFISGIGVHGLGHSHPAILNAGIQGALEDVAMQGNLQQHPPSVRLCERLLALAGAHGAPLEHCFLSTSGAMANENAIKIALHARRPADRILAFENAFAGRTLALAALTDRAQYRDGLPLAMVVDYLPYLDPDDPDTSTRRAVDQLRRLLDRYPGRHAAFWAELVAGEGGYYPASHDFIAALGGPLREAGVPIIVDEIQTFARLSRPFAFQHFGLDRWVDIVTVGKITQVCATLYRAEFKPTAPIVSQTFTGSSASISAGLAMLDSLEQEGCFGDDGRNMQLHRALVERLEHLAAEFPGSIRGPFGCGMMVALTPFDGSAAAATRMTGALYEEGLIAFVCGGNPARVRFLPPPAATRVEHLDAAAAIIRNALVRMRDTPGSQE